MTVVTVTKTIGATGVFSTPALWEDGAPADLRDAEKSAAGTFLVAAFVQGEDLTFIGSGAAGKLIDTDSTGVGTGTYVTYGLTSGNPATSDIITGVTSGATCILTSGTPTNVGVIWQGQCQNQEFVGGSTILIVGGSTDDATSYKQITTVSGASFKDNVNVQTNALRYNASNGCGLRTTNSNESVVIIGEGSTRISYLQLSASGSSSFALNVANSGGNFNGLILETSGSPDGPLSMVNGVVRNSLIVQRMSVANSIAILNTALGGTAAAYNCTFSAPDDLATAPTVIIQSSGDGVMLAQNCGLFAGDSSKAIQSGTTPTFDFTACYSDISGTSGVTQTTYSSEFQNVNAATRDYRLVTGAVQKDKGRTDSINAATDIAGTTRPSGAGSVWDVGCWEFVEASTAPVFVTRSTMRW